MSFWGDPVKAEISDSEKARKNGERRWISYVGWVNHDRGRWCMDKPKKLRRTASIPGESRENPVKLLGPFFCMGIQARIRTTKVGSRDAGYHDRFSMESIFDICQLPSPGINHPGFLLIGVHEPGTRGTGARQACPSLLIHVPLRVRLEFWFSFHTEPRYAG
jgi:hypothetical protein